MRRLFLERDMKFFSVPKAYLNHIEHSKQQKRANSF
jgi:hypothetical protein